MWKRADSDFVSVLLRSVTQLEKLETLLLHVLAVFVVWLKANQYEMGMKWAGLLGIPPSTQGGNL